MNSEQLKSAVVDAVDNMKGLDIVELDVQEVSSFTDYMIIASGNSDTHVRAIASNASTELSAKGIKAIGEEGADVSEWVLVDFGGVVLHVMRPEVREFYNLEKLWNTEVRKLLEENQEVDLV